MEREAIRKLSKCLVSSSETATSIQTEIARAAHGDEPLTSHGRSEANDAGACDQVVQTSPSPGERYQQKGEPEQQGVHGRPKQAAWKGDRPQLPVHEGQAEEDLPRRPSSPGIQEGYASEAGGRARREPQEQEEAQERIGAQAGAEVQEQKKESGGTEGESQRVDPGAGEAHPEARKLSS